MSNPLTKGLIDFFKVSQFIAIPVLAVIIGSIIGLKGKLSDNTISDFQHLVAGIVIAAVGTELIPEVAESEKRSERIGIIIGFAVGAAVMITSKYLFQKHYNKAKEGSQMLQEARLQQPNYASPRKNIPWSLYIASAIDVFIDGLLIGIAFGGITGVPIGSRKDIVVGIVLAIGLGIEGFFLTFSTNSTLKEFNAPKGALYTAPIVYALGMILGSFGGITVIASVKKKAPAVYTGVLAFGVAALIWLALSLIVRSHQKSTQSLLKPILFFAGFIGIILINWITKFFAK